MEDTRMIVLMTADEARQCADAIRSNLGNLRRLVLDLYNRQGYIALGYSSWRECVTTEFQFSQGQLYRLLVAAQTEQNISPIGEIGIIREGHLRELVGLEPEQQREVWQRAIDTAPSGRITAAHVAETARAFDYKRDNKSSRAANEYVPQGFDACQTPPYAIDPLLPYLNTDWTIWEPAQGERLLVEAFYDSGFANVEGSDLLTDQNFFEYQPSQWDCLVTNPPFSLKYKWLERCYELGKPFALLVPVETLGAKTAQELMQHYGFEILLLNRRVAFKMPNKGWDSHPQFPVLWLCWQLLPDKVLFGEITSGDYE